MTVDCRSGTAPARLISQVTRNCTRFTGNPCFQRHVATAYMFATPNEEDLSEAVPNALTGIEFAVTRDNFKTPKGLDGNVGLQGPAKASSPSPADAAANLQDGPSSGSARRVLPRPSKHVVRVRKDTVSNSIEHFKCIVRRHQLRMMVPLADTTIYEMEQRGEFPRRIYLTPRCAGWDLDEIEAWIEERRRASGAPFLKSGASPDVRKRKTRPVKP